MSTLAPHTIGHDVRIAREDAGLTREALAAQVHVSTSTVTRLEREDRLPNPAYLARIADALGLSLDRLLKVRGERAS
jgi:transcriptional regulator with XRE-family HTH domain